MSTEAWLIISVITGACGLGYFIYGKKQSRPVPFVVGLALMIYPYFFDSYLATISIGVCLLIIPLIYRPEW